MQQSERLSIILERLAERGSVAVALLAQELDVSAATIRRDLGLLDSQRLMTRTHGGATARGLLYELPLRYKAARHGEEKLRIALAAAERVKDGAAVGLTGGTTTTEVSRAIADRPGLTIVTNALNIAAELAVRPNLRLVVPGGVARSESYELVGPLAETSLQNLYLDIVFVGVDGHVTVMLALVESHQRVAAVATSARGCLFLSSAVYETDGFASVRIAVHVSGIVAQ